MTTKMKSKPRRRTAASRGPAVPDIIQNERTWMDASASQAAPIAGIAADDLHNIVPAMYQAWGAYGYQPALTWYQLANMYVSWEYTATEKIARTLASLPAKLYRYENAAGKTLKPYFVKSLTFAERLKQSTPERIAYKLRKDHGIKRVEIDEHPFLDLVNRPNPDMVRFNFWRLLAIHLELNGAVGIYKARIDGFGNPTELYILPTTWTGQFKPVPATDGVRLIKEYRLLDQNINEPFTLDEIIWIHYTSLRNPFEGMSAIKAQLYSFNMDTYLMQQINAFYKNGAMFSNVFSTEARMTQKEYNEIAAQLTNYQGAKNAGQKFILHSGLKMEKPLNATARESMVDAIEKMARDKMLSSHDLSAGKIGLVESQNRSNLETVDMGFFNEAIKPRAMLITEYFDQYLVKNYDDNLDFEFDYPHFQDRVQDIAERQSNIINGLTTRNEERDKMGLEPIDGGDVILVSPMNVPLSSVVNPPEPPPVAAVDSGDGGAPDGGTAPTDDNGDGKPIVNDKKPDTKGGPGSGRYPAGSSGSSESGTKYAGKTADEYEAAFGVKPAKDDADLERFLADVEKTPDVQARTADMEKAASEAGGSAQSWSQVQNQVNGQYTQERQALHDEIVDKMLTEKSIAPAGEKPDMVLMLGPPGSGKSTAGIPYALEITGKTQDQFVTVDADKIKFALGANNDNVAMYHEESSDIAEKQLIPGSMSGNHNTILDMTGANVEKMERFANEYEKRGYNVHVIGVKVSNAESANRAWSRHKGGEGRYVPPAYAAKTVDGKPEKTYKLLSQNPNVKTWTLIDNSGTSAKKIDGGKR